MTIENVEIKNFIDLDYDEKQMILSWRNHNEIKKWMYTQENIPLQNHLNYIKSLEHIDDKQYFLVKKNDMNLGAIYFTKIDKNKKECEFGLYANPFEKVAGAGSVLLEVGTRYAFDMLKLEKLKLEFFEENSRAENLYKKYNFKEVAQKTVDDKKVICMELSKDMIK